MFAPWMVHSLLTWGLPAVPFEVCVVFCAATNDTAGVQTNRTIATINVRRCIACSLWKTIERDWKAIFPLRPLRALRCTSFRISVFLLEPLTGRGELLPVSFRDLGKREI